MVFNCTVLYCTVLYIYYRPEELDVKVEGNNIIITAKQNVQEAGGTR